MATFKVAWKHDGLIPTAIGMNFCNSKGEHFIYFNPETAWFECKGDFNEFVRLLIEINLGEFLCSQTLKPHPLEKGTAESSVKEEGEVMPVMSLCDNKDGILSFLDIFMNEGCPCDKTAKRMLGDF